MTRQLGEGQALDCIWMTTTLGPARSGGVAEIIKGGGSFG
jgi:hypothetical protein